jgi:hypothetical protein
MGKRESGKAEFGIAGKRKNGSTESVETYSASERSKHSWFGV